MMIGKFPGSRLPLSPRGDWRVATAIASHGKEFAWSLTSQLFTAFSASFVFLMSFRYAARLLSMLF
jgi:hypothetical protein